jgi:hypothetical protein
MAAMSGIAQAALAREAGVSKQAVSLAIRRGVLVAGADRLIDVTTEPNRAWYLAHRRGADRRGRAMRTYSRHGAAADPAPEVRPAEGIAMTAAPVPKATPMRPAPATIASELLRPPAGWNGTPPQPKPASSSSSSSSSSSVPPVGYHAPPQASRPLSLEVRLGDLERQVLSLRQDLAALVDVLMARFAGAG